MTPNSVKRLDRTSPVVIGCNGGSGSRVLAEISRELGIYMGIQDNQTLDNIWFPSFFFDGITYFFDNLAPQRSEIFEALELFEDLMFSPFVSIERMIEARMKWFGFMLKMQKHHTNYVFKSSRFQKIYQLQSSDILSESMFNHWGWKEPISHFYLKYLNEHFPNMRYIHLLRNGLDMAYTKNFMHYWLLAKFYKIQIPQNVTLRPKAYLNIWLRSNLTTIEECQKLLKERFIIIKFEELCTKPVEQIKKIASFLNINCSDDKIIKLANSVKCPTTIGRYKAKDLSIFSPGEITALNKFGY